MQQCRRITSLLPLRITSRTPGNNPWPPAIVQNRPWILSKGCTLPRHGSTLSSACWSTCCSLRDQKPSTPLSTYTCSDHHLQSQVNPPKRFASSASNSKWLTRQTSDRFTREAKVQNLKSRAAFKLLQINERYKIVQPGDTVVDLGYAPGSWSQVAIDLVKPGYGRVIGVDIIPIQPPRGVNGIQGDFLSPEVQSRVRDFVQDEAKGRVKQPSVEIGSSAVQETTSYVDKERDATDDEGYVSDEGRQDSMKCVDVVLSDMSEPWELTSGLWKNSISNPYRRMMNTTGNKFRDHAGSMDLCRSALYFSYETLKVGGNFVCKFYQGAEDKQLEKQLRAMFHKVHREKPESSRSESRESFFVCLRKLAKVDPSKVFDEG